MVFKYLKIEFFNIYLPTTAKLEGALEILGFSIKPKTSDVTF